MKKFYLLGSKIYGKNLNTTMIMIYHPFILNILYDSQTHYI